MGSHPYFYFTPYHANLDNALQALRQQEFTAGRYYPAVENPWDLPFPPTETSPAPGAQHDSIEDAIEAADASGTGTILDISSIQPTPTMLAASPLSEADLLGLWGTTQPSRDQIVALILGEVSVPHTLAFDIDRDFWETIERGECRYIIVYDAGLPSEIFFVGFSVD